MTDKEANHLIALLRQLAREGREATEVIQANHDLSSEELVEAIAQLEDLW